MDILEGVHPRRRERYFGPVIPEFPVMDCGISNVLNQS